MTRRRKRTKKLLVATVGLATINFAGCGGGTVGNLIIPPGCEATGRCDAGPNDAGPKDTGQADAGEPDSGERDGATSDGG